MEILKVPVTPRWGHPKMGHLGLGDLLAGPLDDPERARVHYNAFLRHAPDHPRAAEVRRGLGELAW
jgi:hypothetical protein